MAKDAKGHGSEKRGGLPRGTVPAYAGRDALGRTYTGAIRDHDRFPKQNPTMPNAEDYRTDQDAARQLAQGNPKAAPVPVHSGANGPSLRESLDAFKAKYGGPRDHAAEQRGFNRGRREINRLKRQGK